MSANKPQEVVYLVGWQENRAGINLQSLSFIFQDGHIETIDKFQEGHAWLYPVEFMPEEKV